MSPIGVTVTTSEALGASAVPTSTGTAFFVGLADSGPATPVKCQSISDYASISVFGPRTATSSVLYDAVDAYFREGGGVLYVQRVTGASAAKAAVSPQLKDVAAHPCVQVIAKYAGVAGNLLYVKVGVSGGNYTVTIQDSAANILETHGPYATASGNAPLLADTTSTLVDFTQGSGSGFTTAAPDTLAATVLTGGANPSGSDINDAAFVSAMALIPASLGPGQIVAPGKTTAAVWNGLFAHAQANNRFALWDMADSATAATQTAAAAAITATTTQAGYGLFIASSAIIPGTTPGTTRTVAGSAVVAALCSQVSAAGNDNRAPAGMSWPLTYVTGFTNTYNNADTITLNNAGINVFANLYNVLCLYGFSTYAQQTAEPIFWQASASRERMALVAQATQLATPYLFATIDGRQQTITALKGDLQGLIQRHWLNNALYGANAIDAGVVNTDAPINTPTTIAAGQLNAAMTVRISPFANAVTISIVFVPTTIVL